MHQASTLNLKLCHMHSLHSNCEEEEKCIIHKYFFNKLFNVLYWPKGKHIKYRFFKNFKIPDCNFKYFFTYAMACKGFLTDPLQTIYLPTNTIWYAFLTLFVHRWESCLHSFFLNIYLTVFVELVYPCFTLFVHLLFMFYIYV